MCHIGGMPLASLMGWYINPLCVCIWVSVVWTRTSRTWSAVRCASLVQSRTNWSLFLLCMCVTSVNSSLCVQEWSAASRRQSQHLCSLLKEADFRELSTTALTQKKKKNNTIGHLIGQLSFISFSVCCVSNSLEGRRFYHSSFRENQLSEAKITMWTIKC